jgi:excisionase family DNA binding protein
MRTDNTWLSIPKAAKLLGRSNSAVLRAIERGAIPCQKIPGAHVRIAARVISSLIAGSYEPAESPAPLREPTPADKVSVRKPKPVGAA